MKKTLLRLLALISVLSSTASAQSSNPCIWSGILAICLPSGGVQATKLVLPENGTGSDKITVNAPASIGSGYTLTLPPDDGSANQFLETNGSGVLTWSAIDLSSDDVSDTLTMDKGGTNSNLTAVNGGLVWSDANSFEITAAGTASQWVLSGGAGTPTMSNTTTTGKIIDGSADEEQLILEANGTQNDDIFLIRSSGAGANYLRVKQAGEVELSVKSTGATGIGNVYSGTLASTNCTNTTNLDASSWSGTWTRVGDSVIVSGILVADATTCASICEWTATCDLSDSSLPASTFSAVADAGGTAIVASASALYGARLIAVAASDTVRFQGTINSASSINYGFILQYHVE